MFYYEVLDNMQHYLVSANRAVLQEALDTLQKEIDAPTLQPTTLTLDNLTAEQAQAMLAQDEYLRLPAEQITNMRDQEQTPEAEIEEGKLIRVYGKGQTDFNVCLVLRVAHYDGHRIVLVPGIVGV